MKRLKLAAGSLLAALLLVSSAQAHFIWVVAEPAEHPTAAKVYLSEEAGPDDAELLPKIATARTWVLDGKKEPHSVTLKIDGDALVGEIPEKLSGNTVVVNHTYGVMSRGGPSFLLKYYGKSYPSQLPSTWKAVNKADLLPLELTPAISGKTLTLTLTWEGKAAPDCQVTVEGPGLKEKIQGNTDAEGKFTAEIADAGLYSIRARKEEATAGELDGKKYEQTKHYTTLALHVTPATVLSNDKKWPELARGTTSFGAAVVGDNLYIYGGHLGGAHEYLPPDQSNDFLRLSLTEPGKWEALPSGPKRTGLAMIAHQGKIYRVGGFEVVGEGENNLTSTNDFARFDPVANSWEDLAPLPEGRSSHDIVVIGNTLYVVGGWQLKAGESHKDAWLKTAWSCDLSQSKPEWKAVAEPPFQRRAISLATRNGLLYVIGGMKSEGGTTTRVDILDPATGVWSVGPSLLGDGMDGFGTASYCLDGQLVTTTMSGVIQKLSDDGSKWEYLGQLAHSRFFHEMVPWQHSFVIVGGASMDVGKILELENFSVPSPSAIGEKAALVK